jgi:hypothetical protein
MLNKADCKFANDLHRALGTPWAKQFMLAVLKWRMRHASIDTTMDVGYECYKSTRA